MENTISEKLVSGGPIPAAFETRWNTLSGEAKRAALHVEGKAVAKMSELNLKEAVLYINFKAGPCPDFCQKAIPTLMDDGMKLHVVFPEGYGLFTKSGWERIF